MGNRRAGVTGKDGSGWRSGERGWEGLQERIQILYEHLASSQCFSSSKCELTCSSRSQPSPMSFASADGRVRPAGAVLLLGLGQAVAQLSQHLLTRLVVFGYKICAESLQELHGRVVPEPLNRWPSLPGLANLPRVEGYRGNDTDLKTDCQAWRRPEGYLMQGRKKCRAPEGGPRHFVWTQLLALVALLFRTCDVLARSTPGPD